MYLRSLVLPFLLAASACGTEAPPAAAPVGHAAAHPSPPATSTPTAAAPSASAALARVVDPSLVCMVNNQLMAKPQIPVEVNGLTYYGCCAMCKERLANDAAAREATDPVTGETVDKARAIMASDSDGAIRYFASLDTFNRYSAR
jgi:YHS domain-containing protein